MSRDVLIYEHGSSDKQAALLAWAKNNPTLHPIYRPDFHRLQIEKWIWAEREALGYLVMDVGMSESPRRWFGEGYFTFGLDPESDVVGDLREIPVEGDSLDGVIITEVLEHCEDPFRAMAEVRRVLKPGGLLLVTSPFIWVWHGRDDYRDFWRFTREGWELLLKDFTEVTVEPCEWTEEGAVFWDMLRRFECFGHASLTEAATGYLCQGRK
jgi:SAM-dependent methyltransferase